MGLFMRTPAEVKTAHNAWARGDRVLYIGMPLMVNTDPNVLLNQIAAEGWEPTGFTVVLENGTYWAVYLWRRVDPPTSG